MMARFTLYLFIMYFQIWIIWVSRDFGWVFVFSMGFLSVFFYDLFLHFWIVFHAQREIRLPRMCTWEGLLALVVLHSLPKCSTCGAK